MLEMQGTNTPALSHEFRGNDGSAGANAWRYYYVRRMRRILDIQWALAAREARQADDEDDREYPGSDGYAGEADKEEGNVDELGSTHYRDCWIGNRCGRGDCSNCTQPESSLRFHVPKWIFYKHRMRQVETIELPGK